DRPAALERGAERHGRDRADAARRPPAGHRRARPHGLAAGVGVQLASSRGVRRLQMEARPRRRAALTDGRASANRGGHRRRRAEPHARPRTPGVRPHRL
ncbi:MAG: hypothetical protein AVDCRST_MAG40-3168, partial [uncultured Gemmatimonadaceae bacterium]